MRVRFVVAGLVLLVSATVGVVALPFVLAATTEGTGRATTSADPGVPSSSVPTGASSSDLVRVAVVGDSLSAGSTGFLGNGLDAGSWMTYAQGGRIEYVGGWARAGATPDEMAASVGPIGDVDVLVVLAGTNAVRVGASLQDEQTAYDQIVSTISPQRVIVSSIPPYAPNPGGGIRYNRELRQFVESRGWQWFDTWQFARVGDDWRPGFSIDGVHPGSDDGYRALGRVFRREILAGDPTG